MSGKGQIVVVASSRGVIVEARGDDGVISICLERKAVANLVVMLAQADAEHQKLAGRVRP